MKYNFFRYSLAIILLGGIITSCQKMGPAPEDSSGKILLRTIRNDEISNLDRLSIELDSDSSFVFKIPYFDYGSSRILYPKEIMHHGWENKVYDLYYQTTYYDTSWEQIYNTFLLEEIHGISIVADQTLWGREPGIELNDMFSLGYNPEVILVPRKEASSDYAFPYGYDITKPDKISDWINMDLYFPTQVRMAVRETPSEYPQTANLTLTITYMDGGNNIKSKEVTLKNVSLKR